MGYVSERARRVVLCLLRWVVISSVCVSIVFVRCICVGLSYLVLSAYQLPSQAPGS